MATCYGNLMVLRHLLVMACWWSCLACPAVAADQYVKAKTVMVKMRDGVRLATDIYLPRADAKKLPCILMRTPYDRRRYDREVGSMARWEYAVAIQDTRGRFQSEGKAMAFQSDGWGRRQDGYDTVQWLAAQDFCNGRVGTTGASAMGITQALMAPSAPPALKCQYILVAPASLYHESAYVGGVLRKSQVEGWLRGHAHPDALKLTLGHPRYDDHWKQVDAASVAGRVNVPAIHYGGWYDTFCDGTIRGFLTRQQEGGAGAKDRQKLVLGPWTHGGPGKHQFGDFQLPEAARRVPADISPRSWFDRHLKDVDNGAAKLPAVTYYTMGPLDGRSQTGNVWRTADRWPVPATATPFYLAVDATLRTKTPEQPTTARFSYDPRRPVPTHGGRNLYLPAGPMDQRKIEQRRDVLVFSTAPLESDLEVTGNVQATIHVETHAADADVALRLCDVYPDGRSILIAEGIRRLSTVERDRASGRRQSEQGEGKVTPVTVNLWSTSIVFARGHRIRLSVSGSNYPRWEKLAAASAKAGKPTVIRVVVHTGGTHASRLVLPVVKR